MDSIKGIVIDPGHGGKDSGALASDIIEKDLNLIISKYMYDRFNELCVPVKMTRDNDESLDNSERISKINNAFGHDQNVVVLSNHINAGGGEC